MMKASQFVDMVAGLQLNNVFNPYSSKCDRYDVDGANIKRREMLCSLVTQASDRGVDSLWIGRDLGYRGGRRTGLALTDEINIGNHAKRWGIDFGQVTRGAPVAERTAAVIWDALGHIRENVFLWNVFPLHPFEAGNPFTNRSHNASERKLGEQILCELISIVKPRKLIAVGNDAFSSAKRLAGEAEVFNFRHPSYGGQNIFLSQVENLYAIKLGRGKQSSLF